MTRTPAHALINVTNTLTQVSWALAVLVGLQPESGPVTSDDSVFVTELRNLPEGWQAVLAAGVVAAALWLVVWLYRNEGRAGASTRRRTVLGILRCAVLVTLAVILLEPVRVKIVRRWQDSYALLLVDTSSSMGLADIYPSPADAARVADALGVEGLPETHRVGIVNELLNREQREFLGRLARKNRVNLYTFSTAPKLVGTIRSNRESQGPAGAGESGSAPSDAARPDALHTARTLPMELSALGDSTNVERAIRGAVEALGTSPLAGVVVLSDGGFNEGASASDTARFARDREVAIHAVGIGDPSPPRNVRVIEVLAPENAFKRDPFTISARLAAEGLDGRTIDVNLREHGLSGDVAAALVDTRRVVVAPGGAIEAVTFVRSQARTGRFAYAVEVPVLPDESVADDNSRQTTVSVIESRSRVLIISGLPSWDYRYLSRLLQRDESMNVSCWLQSADLSAVRDGDTVIDHLPRLPEEIYDYDVLVLLDPDGTDFDEEWCRAVDNFVTEYGGGLLFAAARTNAPSFLRAEQLKPLHDLLPVALDPDADLVLNQIGHYQPSGSPLAVPEVSFGHPILQLADDPVATKLAWRGIGGVHWHYPVLREKPVATVLMRHGDRRMSNSFGGHVLAAVQFIGAGRTGFVAFDGTWRWRRYGEEVYNRFWVQFVRHLAEGKLLGGTRRGMIMTESDQLPLGQAVNLTARVLNDRYEPIPDDEIAVRCTVDGQTTELTLTARPDSPGWFEGRFVPNQTGSYRLSLTLPASAAGDALEAAREIRVSRPNLEILRPHMDRDAMMTLAHESAGGRYYDVHELFEVPENIPDLHEEISVRSPPVTLWDNWVVWFILVGLLSVEWFVRKWSRLL